MSRSIPAALEQFTPEDRATILRSVPEASLLALNAEWSEWAHGGQTAPDGDWRVWVMMAGRGFGKTISGAEWALGLVRASASLGTGPSASLGTGGARPSFSLGTNEEGEGPLSPLACGESPSSSRGEGLRVVIGVDPPAMDGGADGRGAACGIVAAGVRDGVGYMLGDHSVAGLSPEG